MITICQRKLLRMEPVAELAAYFRAKTRMPAEEVMSCSGEGFAVRVNLATKTSSFSGGRVIVHHGHIQPVLIRAWSPAMNGITATIWASQTTLDPGLAV